jgi:hypothetical protein
MWEPQTLATLRASAACIEITLPFCTTFTISHPGTLNKLTIQTNFTLTLFKIRNTHVLKSCHVFQLQFTTECEAPERGIGYLYERRICTIQEVADLHTKKVKVYVFFGHMDLIHFWYLSVCLSLSAGLFSFLETPLLLLELFETLKFTDWKPNYVQCNVLFGVCIYININSFLIHPSLHQLSFLAKDAGPLQ